ncbi:MAG: metallopeptidase family protein [Elusimicrobiaceae bacterium]
MTIEEIEKIIADTADSIPAEFKDKMDNVVIVARARPGGGRNKNLLGLYQGIPLTERGQNYSGVMPDKITIFYGNIEDTCSNDTEMGRVIAHTVLHELAHHFGVSDAQLRKDGNY